MADAACIRHKSWRRLATCRGELIFLVVLAGAALVIPALRPGRIILGKIHPPSPIAESPAGSTAKPKPRPRRCYYDLMGVPKDANEKMIKDAYSKLSIAMHPDKNKHLDKAITNERMKLVTEAYEVLSDRKKRLYYDAHRSKIMKGKATVKSLMDQQDEEQKSKRDERRRQLEASQNQYARVIRKAISDSYFESYKPGSKGFYEVYGTLFRNIGQQEDQNLRENATASGFLAPDFGGLLTSLQSSNRFYKYWENFDSQMSFEWADTYAASMGRNRRERQIIERENQLARRRMRQEYQNAVRDLVAFVKDRDLRLIQHRLDRLKEIEREVLVRVRFARVEEERQKGEYQKVLEQRKAEFTMDDMQYETKPIPFKVLLRDYELFSTNVSSRVNMTFCPVCDSRIEVDRIMVNHLQRENHKNRKELYRGRLRSIGGRLPDGFKGSRRAGEDPILGDTSQAGAGGVGRRESVRPIRPLTVTSRMRMNQEQKKAGAGDGGKPEGEQEALITEAETGNSKSATSNKQAYEELDGDAFEDEEEQGPAKPQTPRKNNPILKAETSASRIEDVSERLEKLDLNHGGERGEATATQVAEGGEAGIVGGDGDEKYVAADVTGRAVDAAAAREDEDELRADEMTDLVNPRTEAGDYLYGEMRTKDGKPVMHYEVMQRLEHEEYKRKYEEVMKVKEFEERRALARSIGLLPGQIPEHYVRDLHKVKKLQGHRHGKFGYVMVPDDNHAYFYRKIGNETRAKLRTRWRILSNSSRYHWRLIEESAGHEKTAEGGRFTYYGRKGHDTDDEEKEMKEWRLQRLNDMGYSITPILASKLGWEAKYVNYVPKVFKHLVNATNGTDTAERMTEALSKKVELDNSLGEGLEDEDELANDIDIDGGSKMSAAPGGDRKRTEDKHAGKIGYGGLPFNPLRWDWRRKKRIDDWGPNGERLPIPPRPPKKYNMHRRWATELRRRGYFRRQVLRRPYFGHNNEAIKLAELAVTMNGDTCQEWDDLQKLRVAYPRPPRGSGPPPYVSVRKNGVYQARREIRQKQKAERLKPWTPEVVRDLVNKGNNTETWRFINATTVGSQSFMIK